MRVIKSIYGFKGTSSLRGTNKFLANNKVADVIIESLIAAGVKRIYGFSGDSLYGITDSVREHDKVAKKFCS